MVDRRLDPSDPIAILGRRLDALKQRVADLEAYESTPNDAAAMLMGNFASEGAQSIPNAVWTYVDFDFSSGGTWDLGLEIEDGHVGGGDNIDKVRTQGVPGESIFFFTMEVNWDSHNTGKRGIRWLAGDGSIATYERGALDGTPYSEIHWRRQPVANEYYTVQVYQNSGAALDLHFFNFGVFRLR